MSELLQEQIMKKEIEISYLKAETICKKQEKIETCTNIDTQTKFNNISTILDEIMSFQWSLEDKNGIGYKTMSDVVCKKCGLGSNQ